MPAWLFATLYAGAGAPVRRHRQPVGRRAFRASRRHGRQRAGGHAMAAARARDARAEAPYPTARETARLRAHETTILNLAVLRLPFSCCAASPAHAEWVRRVTDGIMGTRITVELWAEDHAKGEQAIDAVLDEMRHIDETMSTYKPTSEVSQVNAKAADGPMHISKELFDLLVTAKRVLGDHRRRVRHHLRERRLHVRFPQARAPGRGADRQGTAGRQLPPRDPRSEESDGAVLAERRAHRSRAASPRATRWTAASTC